MKITFNARNDFATLAEAAGTSLETLLKEAADRAVTDGEQAQMEIQHDENVIQTAKVRIQRSKIALKKATNILKKVNKYVS